MIIRIVFLLMLLASSAWGQPAVVDEKHNSRSHVTGAYSDLTISSLAVSGDAPGVAVCLYKNGTVGPAVIGVAFNTSETFDKVAEFVSGNASTEVWYLPDATATTADVVITLSSTETSGLILASAVAFSEVQDDAPTLSDTGNCSTCTLASLDLTSTVDNTMMVTCTRSSAGTGTFTHGAGQTERTDIFLNESFGDSLSVSTELKVTAGTETLTSTSSGSSSLQFVFIGIEPLVAPPPPPPEGSRRRSGVLGFK